MGKWVVEVSWNTVIEAEDEGEALMQADREFSFMREANAENLEDEIDEPQP